MQSSKALKPISLITHYTMLKLLNKRIKRLCSRLRWPVRRRSNPIIVIKRFDKSNTKSKPRTGTCISAKDRAKVHQDVQSSSSAKTSLRPIRIATFNASLFCMAPAMPKPEKFSTFEAKFTNGRPKSILKQSPLHPNSNDKENNLSQQRRFVRSKLRVSINLPDNEISLLKNRQLSSAENEKDGSSSRVRRDKSPLRSTVLEVLRELDADILALQDVKAEEEKAMKPLSDLAAALGMNYVFAESWAPEYGNAVLSKWPIKHRKVHKIFDDTDIRNVLKATIDVPEAGEVEFHCTHLDHLDEEWRMKQMNAIIESNEGPHILAGGLNSLEETDYSKERWTDIVKYHEEMGKPIPKVEVMNFLKNERYTDAKDFAGECEPVVVIAKGQSVQGTCKYGTRVDYILASPNSPYKFVPGSYSVLSSKGTSDHHIVKVDMVIDALKSVENKVNSLDWRFFTHQELMIPWLPKKYRVYFTSLVCLI